MRWPAAVVAAALIFPSAAPAAASPEVTAVEAARIAGHDPNVGKETRANGTLTHAVNKVDGNWEVGYFADDKEVALVIVDPQTGLVRESWTGYQVAWKMARGYSGAFGHKLNAPYVFLPLCAIFLLGLVDWRRLRRIANLDLLVLLGFGVSNFFFNRAEIGVSVPLQYIPLAYLFGRALWIGLRGGGEGIRPRWPAAWLLIAALFLVGFRVGLNMADSGAIDVGYAGVVGADRIVHGEPVYDNFPEDVSQGDTYGPVNYIAYVPFERIWPWSGTWNDLPAAHGAAVFFDLATFALLIFLGRRIRPGPAGNKLAATLAFGWAAYPYTAFTLLSNSNDSLVAMLLVGTLLVLARPAARGVMSALATLAKFAPAVLVPMLVTYRPAGPVAAGNHPPLPVAKASSGAGTPYGATRGSYVWHCLRANSVCLAAVARDQPRPSHVLRAHDCLPGWAELAIQHLGSGSCPRTPAHRDHGRSRRIGSALCFPPQGEAALPSGRAGSGSLDRRPADDAPLVLPLHRLVLPPPLGGDGGQVPYVKHSRAAAGCSFDIGDLTATPT